MLKSNTKKSWNIHLPLSVKTNLFRYSNLMRCTFVGLWIFCNTDTRGQCCQLITESPHTESVLF